MRTTRNTIEITENLDHARGLARIAAMLMDEKHGVFKDTSNIAAVGHRRNRGKRFRYPVALLPGPVRPGYCDRSGQKQRHRGPAPADQPREHLCSGPGGAH